MAENNIAQLAKHKINEPKQLPGFQVSFSRILDPENNEEDRELIKSVFNKLFN